MLETRYMAQSGDDTQAPRYLIAAHWPHIFDGARAPATVRFVFERVSETICRLEMLDGAVWILASRVQLEDVQDSLLNANEDALSSPSDYGLTESEYLPEWAAKSSCKELP